MLDHVFLTVSDINRSVAFYTQTLAPLGITKRVDYDGKDGPPGHPGTVSRRPRAVMAFSSATHFADYFA